ncbi:MAG: Cell division protein FtsL [Oceanicaulis sp. HLUCCA04]|nr:MAG: Cell division protein FtsL [Oceanicaulis sp. HLUCCA04]
MIRLFFFFGILGSIILLCALYVAKAETDAAQAHLASLQAELAQERARINTLEANIAHLEDPEQLRALARTHLGFEPIHSAQELSLAELAQVRAEAERMAPQTAQASWQAAPSGVRGRP